MAEITTATLGQLLKNLYASWEIEQLVNLTYPVLGQIASKGSAQLGGNGFFFPVRTQSAEGHAYISEDQDLPTAQQSTVRQAEVDPTVHAGVVQLTGLSMAISSGSAMAFARSFDENVQQTLEAMSAYKEGALFRSGDGVIATFNGAVATSAGPHTCDDVQFLRPGMQVAIFDESTRAGTDEWIHGSGSGATAGRLTIESVDWPNRTVTFTAAVEAAVDDNDTVYIAGSQSEADGTAPTTKEPLGLEASLLDSGTYLGIARGTYDNWKANLLTASGFFDEDILLRARSRITQETGIPLQAQSGRFKVVTHPTQVDVLFKLAIPKIRYSGNDKFDLGNDDNVYFGRTPFLTSYLCPSNTAYVGDWMYHQTLYTPNGELHIDTEYNGSALKWVATRDVGLVFAKEYCQFVNKRPNAFAKITSLTDATR